MLHSSHVIKSGHCWLHTFFTISIKYLFCFFLAGVDDWLGSSSRCSSAGWAGGGWRWSRRKRVGIIDERLPPLSLLDHLNEAVGHKHDDDGGYGEAWEGTE